MDRDLALCLKRYRVPQAGPNPVDCVPLAGTDALAALLDSSPREAMIFCLEQGLWPLRFKANRGVFSPAQQATLLRSHVAVIGCGGLGGHVLLMLGRLGVGTLTVCDKDSFEESNLNRQVLCRQDTLGENKAVVAGRELARVASHAAVRIFACEATPATLPDILDGASLVVDCLDNINTRKELERAALSKNMSFIHGAVAGYEGFALCSRPGGQTPALTRLYGDAPITQGDAAEAKAGVPTPTPAGTAVLQVMLAMRELLSLPPDQDNALLHLDLSVPSLERLLL